MNETQITLLFDGVELTIRMLIFTDVLLTVIIMLLACLFLRK